VSCLERESARGVRVGMGVEIGGRGYCKVQSNV
jgi:hypothetical protein